MDATPEPITPAPLPRKPTRAETARANGARSRGPATPAGKARAARNATRHGLRARSLAPVAALGETPELVAAHVTAYRREFPAPGAYARDLAEAIAAPGCAPPAPTAWRPSCSAASPRPARSAARSTTTPTPAPRWP